VILVEKAIEENRRHDICLYQESFQELVFRLFFEWIRANYTRLEQEEIMNHYIQSGTYPYEFIYEYRDFGQNWAKL